MNKVLEQAQQDYNDNLVAIIDEAIDQLVFSEDQKNILERGAVQELKGRSLFESVHFLIGLHSINYQYWDLQEDRTLVRYKNNGNIGALASFDGFLLLFEQLKLRDFDVQWINAEVVSQCYGPIPDLEGRVLLLKESLNLENIKKVFDGINEHVHDQNLPFDTNLASRLAHLLPLSYDDAYLKKMQLALYEIAQVYQDHGFQVSCDITVAADYQLPKVLEGLGVLRYHKNLQDKIQNHELINEGGLEEKAIRSATVIACDRISKKHGISIPALDRFLWLIRNDFNHKNFHLTRGRKY